MNNPVPRAAAINDLSGFGRASLSVVSPILSTMGVQVCQLPTALLSTHTGFEGFTFLDLTENMKKMISHWKQLDVSFQAIYSGFLGSIEQTEIIADFMTTFGIPGCLKVIDPVMGDNGKLYPPFSPDLVAAMRGLMSHANIITPNMTEAALLLKRPYKDTLDREETMLWLHELSLMGPDIVVLTGIMEEDRTKTSVAAFNKLDGRYWKTTCAFIPASYPGTGDAFTSVIVGSLLQGDSLPTAIDRAVIFVTCAIRATFGYRDQPREGFLLEKVLSVLNAPVLASSYQLL